MAASDIKVLSLLVTSSFSFLLYSITHIQLHVMKDVQVADMLERYQRFKGALVVLKRHFNEDLLLMQEALRRLSEQREKGLKGGLFAYMACAWPIQHVFIQTYSGTPIMRTPFGTRELS